MNLDTEKATTRSIEFPRLGMSPFRVSPISANDGDRPILYFTRFFDK